MLSYSEFKKTAQNQMTPGRYSPGIGFIPDYVSDEAGIYTTRNLPPDYLGGSRYVISNSGAPHDADYYSRTESWHRSKVNPHPASYYGYTPYEVRRRWGDNAMEWSLTPLSGGPKRSITIYPNSTIAHRVGEWYRDKLRPPTAKEFLNSFAGDTYWDDLNKHYDSISPEAKARAGVEISSKAERKDAGDYRPTRIYDDDGSISYHPLAGEIHMGANKLDELYDASQLHIPDEIYRGADRATYSSPMFDSPSRLGIEAESFGHELWHLLGMGQYKGGERAYYTPNETLRWAGDHVRGFDRRSSVPTLYRHTADGAAQLAPTSDQYWGMVHNNVEPYILDPEEASQAVSSFNMGRNALMNAFKNDRDNENYKQIPEDVKDQFLKLPRFISEGPEGEKQLDQIMQFYEAHPELLLLTPEQSRFFTYYQNLKAAIKNAETPQMKAYFRELMRKIIYNKAWMANNQRRTAPSYTDVQRMRA